MIFESLPSRYERRIRAWHRKYAFLPRTIGRTTVWLGFYWRRFVDVEVESRNDLQHMFTCLFLGISPGRWEYSVNKQIIESNIIPFKKVS